MARMFTPVNECFTQLVHLQSPLFSQYRSKVVHVIHSCFANVSRITMIKPYKFFWSDLHTVNT